MAKKKAAEVEPVVELVEEPDMEPTDEDIARWEEESKEEREKRLAPYRALARQQSEQDELIAELMFKETMRELEMEV